MNISEVVHNGEFVGVGTLLRGVAVPAPAVVLPLRPAPGQQNCSPLASRTNACMQKCPCPAKFSATVAVASPFRALPARDPTPYSARCARPVRRKECASGASDRPGRLSAHNQGIQSLHGGFAGTLPSQGAATEEPLARIPARASTPYSRLNSKRSHSDACRPAQAVEFLSFNPSWTFRRGNSRLPHSRSSLLGDPERYLGCY